jgi:hypothetical protein
MSHLNPVTARGVRGVAERELIFPPVTPAGCELPRGVLSVVVNHAIPS